MKVARELRVRIKRAFDAEGIEIPFPQRMVWHRGDVAAAAEDSRDRSSPCSRYGSVTTGGDGNWPAALGVSQVQVRRPTLTPPDRVPAARIRQARPAPSAPAVPLQRGAGPPARDGT